MSLTDSAALLRLSPRKDWALGHFNVHNSAMVKAVVQAAESVKAPAILAVGYQSIDHMGLEPLAALIRQFAGESSVPFSLHIDHARELSLVRRSLEAGFTSIMFDGSSLPFEENVRLTSEVAAMARDFGASVEGEIGLVPPPGGEADPDKFTDPALAVEFAERTGVDFLAVSVGSVHGMRAAGLGIDTELLGRISEAVGVPLVLHGASGVTDEAMVEGIRSGLRKINLNTALKVAAAEAVRCRQLDEPAVDFLPLMDCASDAMRDLAVQKMTLFGSAGIAED